MLMSDQGFPDGSMVKNPATNARDTDSIPGSGKCPREENGNPLQYSCLERISVQNHMDWQATVHGIAKESDTT